MYKKDDILKTFRGNVRIVSTNTEFHVINGIHPFLQNGDLLKPNANKDYVIAFKNTDMQSSLDTIYEHLSEEELNSLIIK